ncbi:MAG: aminotransferase class V-fold PLP-dependent enzyme [Actinobacteria bacterium]|nr:aminotransferase class V-fold PLP-dependent enzyme [Actinomycetota bacterium]
MAQRPAPFRDLDWDPERARAFADEIVGVWTELLGSFRDGPVVPPHLTQEAVREAVALDVPDDPMPPDALVAHLREAVLDYSLKSGHPAHLAYITGTGTVPGAAADLLASGLNPNVGGWLLSPAATEIELCLTRWLAGLLGLPETAGGMIVAGGGVANFISLKVARDAMAGVKTRQTGVTAKLAIYCSEEAHVTIDRAADMLGLGTEAVRHVPVDEAFRMRPDALLEAIRADLSAGVSPGIVVGTAGTTATGSIEPLDDLAEIAAEHGMWFHVDAAYGGALGLSDELRPLLKGIERADSITLDPHKWLSTPLGSGCIVVRDIQSLSDSFGVYAAYVHEEEGIDRGLNLGFMGPQFSRGFDALKVWVSLLAHGRKAYATRIEHDIELTRYLAACVEEHPDFELLATGLSICCFRYRPEGTDDEEHLNRLNERLLSELQLDGRVYPSNAIVHGRFCLRTCIVNFRTEADDLDLVLEVAAELGAKLHAGASSTLPS